jgi:perosamine synthetase
MSDMKRKPYYPVAEPVLAGNERNYVMDCIDSNWISSNGKYIEQFEGAFAELCRVRHAVSCSNGTAALHLALLALGLRPGDEVIVPTLTFVSTANAVLYCGGVPVFVDSEPVTWNIDCSKIEMCITGKTKGIIAVHLYGHPVDMDPLRSLANKYNLFVLEDAAEAHGAKYRDRSVGSLGDMATFSFYGNKVLTTGEGGAITTDNDNLADKVKLLKSQGMDPDRRYWFPEIGYNYRMTNIAAAIGLAQVEKADWHVQKRRSNAQIYMDLLSRIPGVRFQEEQTWALGSYWMNTVILNDELGQYRDQIMEDLKESGIETRPVFYPMHSLPIYQKYSGNRCFEVADRLSRCGFNLPSSANLDEDDISFICSELGTILDRYC